MKNRLKLKSGVELAPLVDIVFLLLAFMLINSNLADLPVIEVNLPASRSAVQKDDRTVDIFVRADGALFAGGQAVELAGLSARVRDLGAGPDRDLAIRADEKAPYARVVAVLDTLNAAGFTRFQLVTTTGRDSDR